MRYLHIFIFLTFYFFSTSQNALTNSLKDLYATPFYKHSTLGVAVRDVKSGLLLADISKDKLMIPASTMKLITTFTAYNVLGKDYKFETTISHDGSIANDGTLYGNIYISGNGDPTLGAGRIHNTMDLKALENRIVQDIRQAGILCVQGDIIAVSETDEPPLGDTWQWHDLGNYYATGAWSINVNENLYNIYYNRSMDLGKTALISYIEPYIPNLAVKSFVTVDSVHTADNAFIFGVPYTYERAVRGTIPQGKSLFKIKGAIPDPPLFLAYRMYNALGQFNISNSHFKTLTIGKDSVTKTIISKYQSPAISEIIKSANDFSINLYADALLKAVGNDYRIECSVQNLTSILKNNGYDDMAFHIEDGSGLSARNLMSADFMATFLQKQINSIHEADIPRLMPAAGESGTVKNLLLNSPAKGKIWVKSGSMNKILSYAGYCRSASGKLVSFSVMLNGSVAASQKQNKIELEKILDAIYRFS